MLGVYNFTILTPQEHSKWRPKWLLLSTFHSLDGFLIQNRRKIRNHNIMLNICKMLNIEINAMLLAYINKTHFLF